MPDKPSTRAPCHPPSPRALARCRVEFETFGGSYRNLAAKYRIARSTLNYVATRDNWKRPTTTQPGVQEAADVASQILGAGLRRSPLGQKPSNASRPNQDRWNLPQISL